MTYLVRDVLQSITRSKASRFPISKSSLYPVTRLKIYDEQDGKMKLNQAFVPAKILQVPIFWHTCLRCYFR